MWVCVCVGVGGGGGGEVGGSLEHLQKCSLTIARAYVVS